MKNDIYYIKEAIKEAKKANKINEIPVGTVIVDSLGNIIGRGYNKKEIDNISISHAEINAIIKANKKIGNWRLNDCIMYVTLEPCKMCKAAIEESRIKKVVYLLNNNSNTSKNDSIYIKYDDNAINNEVDQLMNDSFNKIRNKHNCG
jgi:tRNA(adenine34) deaminase